MKNKLKLVSKNKYLLSKENNMNTDCLLYLNKKLFEKFDETECLKQLADAASLPGIVGNVLGMPDIHSGYGLPIGGIMAMDSETGVVSAGGVGMDINCGVRLLSTNINSDFINKNMLHSLIKRIEKYVPTGLGTKSKFISLYKNDFERIVNNGARFLIEKGYGRKGEDNYIEDNGIMSNSDISKVSKKAIKRGNQLGTLGGGNHFIEIGIVNSIYEPDVAKKFSLCKNMITIMIHTGSRGFGHQICNDYMSLMLENAPKYGIKLTNKGLACAPIKSELGLDYLSAMACAVNYAFANRQLITYAVRAAFEEELKEDNERIGLDIVYDLAHNIAKFEKHREKEVLVHRKGATRALPPYHNSNQKNFRETGHPAIIPGSMGTASYVVVGENNEETFYSVNHGSGRAFSRKEAAKRISKDHFNNSIKNILVNVKDYKKIVDESPQAYKNIDYVVNTLSEIKCIKKVVELKPLAVIKGEN